MTAISAGTPLTAPNGFRNLEAGVTYYFLRSSPKTQLVTLVYFVQREAKDVTYKSEKSKRRITPEILPLVVRLRRIYFEAGLSRDIQAGERMTMPPWLHDLHAIDLEQKDADRIAPAKSHADRIDEKLFAINQLIWRAEEIIDRSELELEINRHARSLTPARNETRVRLWFFTYLIFGRNRNALHYPTHRIGKWDRLDATSPVKRGAPGRKGAGHGHNTTREMYDKIIASYREESRITRSQEEIYVAAIKDHFGCKVRLVKELGKTLQEIYHPDGADFPQKETYFYHVNGHFGWRTVRTAKLGKKRARSEIDPFLGTFTEDAWNLMQRVEADGYRVYELPKGYVEGSDLPPLVVVIKRDTASGKKTGIGFNQGSETGSAYRMASFCEAIGLEAFARLFGIKVKCAGKGASPMDITDRGPGATSSALPRLSSLLPIVRELTPAYAGQSKALVETSNPKTPSDDEAPSFTRSGKTVVQLARREIFKLIQFNEQTNVASRIDPEIEHLVTRQSPNGVWEALESLGRNDAVEVGFEDAVRAYLEVVPAVLRRGGLEIAGRNYYSKTPEFLSALEAAVDRLDVKAYVLTACLRHVWFDWNHRLIQLDVRYPVPVGTEVLYMSFEEASEYNEYTEKRDRAFKDHQRAVGVAVSQDYEDQTALKLSDGQRVSGRPKRGKAVARQEASEAARSAAGRKAA